VIEIAFSNVGDIHRGGVLKVLCTLHGSPELSSSSAYLAAIKAFGLRRRIPRRQLKTRRMRETSKAANESGAGQAFLYRAGLLFGNTLWQF
jgi:hypothetical protein